MLDDRFSKIPDLAQDGDAGSAITTLPAGQMRTDRTRYLVIVARDQPDLLRHLKQTLTEFNGVEVILDRRHGGRWQWTQSRERQDQDADRRLMPNRESDLGNRSFLIVPQHTPSSCG